MWEYISVNHVSHLVEDNGRCATCGRYHAKPTSVTYLDDCLTQDELDELVETAKLAPYLTQKHQYGDDPELTQLFVFDGYNMVPLPKHLNQQIMDALDNADTQAHNTWYP